MTVTSVPTTEMPKRAPLIIRVLKSITLLRESYVGMFGAVLVLFWLVMAFGADLMPLRDPLAQSAPDLLKPALSLAPDGSTYWLGTDDKGRDILGGVPT